MNEVEHNKIKFKIIEDFKRDAKGKLEPDIIGEAVKKIASPRNDKYFATGDVQSIVFFLLFSLETDIDKKSFSGKAGGLTSAGFAWMEGYIYTDDLGKLYSDTVSFEFNATLAYFSLLFFDSHSHLLGHFQSAAISTIVGVGGGKGSWS
ncbi:VapA/VapB family virulence-associated protein [Xenorhabdus sp. BG5]|uniref:VapA/VapB family virulence-associated protein n=1 Tax=Xenorhabdus sp. BG5 TaxID=2782014 RepID=UPI00187E6515|nr:VapA/VapB family virulence-associated protein [Xenorhabdus sp. BG5]MBE8597522.1 VapA/VapB family virulence-associated protein [Xenorhabdus sp. BG5]